MNDALPPELDQVTTTRPTTGTRWRRTWRFVRWPLAALVFLLVLAQFVPYGWWHQNPPVAREAPWPDEESARVARESCYSCHSNETDWPLYSYVAPMSWLVRADVEGGREQLNFSEWDEFADEAHHAVDVIRDGTMPPGRYTVIHRDARLSATEQDALVAALEQMDGGSNRGPGGGDGDHSGPGGGGDD